MTKKIAASAVLLAALMLAGCNTGPSCEDKGGKTVATFSHYQPMLVGKVTILQPIYTYTCEMPR